MEQLYEKIKHFNIEDALKFENNDRQFIALEKLYDNYGNNKPLEYLALIICNSLICYQLSGKGEDYWEEFSEYFSNKNIELNDIVDELSIFIKNSKNNKRFIETKIKRLEKLRIFINNFEGKQEYYYKNMTDLRNDLAITMNQKNDDKTIVFAIKMFGYGARNIYEFRKCPKEIIIPVDSRLKLLFEKYKGNYSDINKFYSDLSTKLDIPEIHLDAILWINYNDLIK